MYSQKKYSYTDFISIVGYAFSMIIAYLFSHSLEIQSQANRLEAASHSYGCDALGLGQTNYFIMTGIFLCLAMVFLIFGLIAAIKNKRHSFIKNYFNIMLLSLIAGLFILFTATGGLNFCSLK